jgi:hypothetical protein
VRLVVKAFFACFNRSFSFIVAYCTNLTSCPNGTCANSQGLCQRAPIGSYSDQKGSTSCKTCPVGYYSNLQGSSACTSCEKGKYVSTAGAKECLFCEMGTYSNVTSMSYCFSCPIGRWTNYIGATSNSDCAICAAGYSNLNGTCTACYAGSFSSAGSNSACSLCSPGLFSSSDYSTSCETCPYAMYAEGSGQTRCYHCSVGKFSQDMGLTSESSCAFCPAGKYGNETTSSGCHECYEGSWSNSVGATAQGTCKTCSTSSYIQCPSGSSFPFVDSGYFRSLNIPDLIFNCIPSEACSSTGFSNTTCATGYEGNLCVTCSTNYFRSSGKCTKCISASARWIASILLVIALFVVVSRVARAAQNMPFAIQSSVYWIQFFSILPSLAGNWPSTILWVLNFTNIFNFDIGYIGIGCDLKTASFYIISTLKILVPIFFTIYLSLEKLLLDQWRPATRINRPWTTIVTQVLFVVNIFSIQLFQSTLQVFNCASNGSGSYFLVSDPTIQCYDSSWTQFVGFDLAFLFIYVFGIASVLAWKYKKSLKMRDMEEFDQLIHPLVRTYQKEKRWFELVRILLRFIFILIRDVFQFSNSGKVAFFGLVITLYIWLESHFRPFVGIKNDESSLL